MMELGELRKAVTKPELLGSKVDFSDSRKVLIQVQIDNKPDDPKYDDESGDFIFKRYEYHEATDAGVLFHNGEFKFVIASYKE